MLAHRSQMDGLGGVDRGDSAIHRQWRAAADRATFPTSIVKMPGI